MCESAGEFRTYQLGFILEPKKFTRIVDIIDTYGKKVAADSFVQFRVEKAGKRFYTTKDLNVVLRDDNSLGDGITSLTATLCMPEGTGANGAQTIAAISFRKGVSTPIEFTVEGRDREWCVLLTHELEQQVTRICQKPSFRALMFRASDFVAAIIAGGALLGLLVTIGAKWLPTPAMAGTGAKSGVRELLGLAILHSSSFWLWCGLAAVAALAFVTNEYRPVSRFAGNDDQSVFFWGDGVEAYRRSKSRQSKVLWGVVVGFFVSVGASAVFAWLWPPV